MNQPLEARLLLLADEVDWPEAPRMAETVTAALQSPATASKNRRLRWLAVAAAVVVATVTLLTWAPARRAAADLLGVFGIRIEETSTIGTVSFDLDLGSPIAPDEIVAQVGYAPLAPTQLGAPDGIYVETRPPHHLLSVWLATEELPEVGDTGVGLLLSQFPSSAGTVGLQKDVGPEASVTSVSVGGIPGFWIEGGPHEVSYIDEDGATVFDSTRLAGNVLIWAPTGKTYRLESGLSLDSALTIAESLTPASP